MDRQKYFSMVKEHLLKQNCKSVRKIEDADVSEYCAYRGEDGRKCAFGIFIPDELYSPVMEGSSCSSVFMTEVLTRLGATFTVHPIRTNTLEGDDINFFCKLQQLHDSCYVLSWEDALRDFAKEYDLEYGD